MKILFISQNQKLFDSYSNEREYLNEMSQAAETVHAIVLTLQENGRKTERLDDHTWLYPTNSRSSFFFIFDAWRIIRSQVYWKWKLRADVIISDDPEYSGWIGTISSRWYKKRWIVNIYKNFWESINPKKRKLSLLSRKYLLRWADSLCVFSSPAEKLLIADKNKKSRAEIISFTTIIDVEGIRKAEIETNIHDHYPKYKFIVLVVLPLKLNQNIELPLETLSLLRKRYNQAGMIVISHEDLNLATNTKIVRLGLTDWISLEKSDTNLVSYFKTTNVFISFSTLEEDEERYVLIKAAAAGAPIISLDSSLAREIITDGENGILVPQKFSQLFLFSIIKANETPGLREQFRLGSDRSIIDKFGKSKEELKIKLRNVWLGRGNYPF